MASLRGSRTSAIGLFVDGHEIKIAKLSLRGKSVVLDEIQSATLVTKLEERHIVEMGVETFTPSGDTFSLSTTEPIEEVVGDNNTVVLGLLSKYPAGKYVLSYALAEPSIYYHIFETDFGLSGKKLKKRVLDELKNVRATQPALDAIDFFKSSDQNLVCIIREDGLALFNVLEGIKQFLGKQLPRLSLIESADVALIHLARANYGFAPDEFTAIIYVGVEFTRLIFMKGTEFFHFAPVIGEGYESPNIQNTVYSRLLLEQDNMGIPRIDKILLAGESGRIHFDEFLRDQLLDVEVQFLKTPYLDVSHIPPEQQDLIPQYAIPVATAWKVLLEDHPAFYPINLLPESIREGQRAFKLAWHGYLLFLLVFLSAFFFTVRYNDLQPVLSEKKTTLERLRATKAENERMNNLINELNAQITRYNQALSIYDSLVPGSDQWSRAIEQLTKGVDDVNNIWIEEVRSLGGGAMTVKGYALYRTRIPRIAALLDNATLSEVTVVQIREKTPPVYRFVITVPPLKPIEEIPSQAGTP